MIAADPVTDLDRAKDRIARAVLDAGALVGVERVGSITLRPHQTEAVCRIARMLERNGGAVLADAVGLGKTFIAIAAARRYTHPLVVAPAALRDMWGRAMRDARVSLPFVTTQALSAGVPALTHRPDLVIVDEAHHFRSHLAKRYAALASVCTGARVLLLSATPVQNRREDLLAQLALFLGSEAAGLTDAELSRFVIRRDALAGDQSLPAISGPHGVRLPANDDLLDDLLALPSPIPASDEGVAGALGAYSMLHLWSSSRAALVGSLRRRRARAHAMRDVLVTGRIPSRHELAAWRFEEGTQQLAMADLLFAGPAEHDVGTRLEQVEAYIEATSSVLDRARTGDDPDRHRAALLEGLLEAHRGERIVVFSQYAETVAALGGWLRRAPGIAVMTGRGARIASGGVTRADVLAQFDPADQRSRTTPAIERIDLLLTTDVLSEGVNLHDASVVVHLDLPWNPARLEQRVGRVRRLGSRHDAVTTYAVLPPAPVERLIGIERRLRAKLATAHQSVGAIGSVLPDYQPEHATASAPDVTERVRIALAAWRHPDPAWAAPVVLQEPVIATVTGDTSMLLAAIVRDDETILLAGTATLSTDPSLIERAIGQVESSTGEGTLPAHALEPLAEWLEGDRARALARDGETTRARARRDALARIAAAVDNAPRHRWAYTASLAATARDAVTGLRGAGAERALAELLLAESEPETLLRSLAGLGRHAAVERGGGLGRGRVLAVIYVSALPGLAG
jgi:superfamily II DNA or RNA helicase